LLKQLSGKVNEKNDPSGVGAPDGPIKSARVGAVAPIRH
jgi:hypothetical protein